MESLVDKNIFNNSFLNKKVLITGNTGFKGSWLSLWLKMLGANVFGISIDDKDEKTLFNNSKFTNIGIKTFFQDIRDLSTISETIESIKPDIIFHLAAQAIVSDSYKNPINTITTNVTGTSNILEIVRTKLTNCIVIVITSDKCYENVEWLWGYRENDRLGGKDIYSASKACAENIFYAYYNSFFKGNTSLKIASARAGNVIGGGDWSENRIIPDCYRSWTKGESVVIRNPKSTRPWQHVLEPLSGYLILAQNLILTNSLSGEAFNFGPNDVSPKSVSDLITDLYKYQYSDSNVNIYDFDDRNSFNEANLLKLNCDKSNQLLEWEPVLDYKEVVKFTADWYINHKEKKINEIDYTIKQINEYIELAKNRNLRWTKCI